MSKFFTYRQNNSGGGFAIDENVKEYVIIEAHSSEKANKIAESIGVYFDGVYKGKGCSCCGDRWSEHYDSVGDTEPMIYDTPVYEADGGLFSKHCIVHYLDGSKEVVKLK